MSNPAEFEVMRLQQIIEKLENERGELLERTHLAESQEELKRLIIDKFSDGLLLLDDEKKILVANPVAIHLLRLTEQQTTEGAVISGFENDNTAKLWIALHNAQPSVPQELEFNNSVSIQLEVSNIEHNEKKYTIIVFRDRSHDKALKEMKGEFVSIAAHQLRTPLAAIKWAFEIALSGLVKDTDPYKAAERGHESSERMLELVNSLLDVDRIESSRFDYRFEAINFSEIVQQYVEDTIQEKALLHGVRISYGNEAGKDMFVNADKQKITLVLQNLLENALKYTPQGGQVRVALSHNENKAILSIDDTGIGIPLQDQGRLFEKFFRADNAKRTVADGSGLGLYIIRRIVESHGGTITFKSELGKGSTFIVAIPTIDNK